MSGFDDSSRAIKRVRANTAGDGHKTAPVTQQRHQVWKKSAPETHPAVRDLIQDALNAKRAEEARRVIDFDPKCKSVWREINITHSRLSESRQYDASMDVFNYVENSIESIVKQCGPFASAGTWYNGLPVLRKIGKTIAMGPNDVIGSEIRKEFGHMNPLDEGMLSILKATTLEELTAIWNDELYEKFKELDSLAQDYCLFPQLEKVFELLDEAADDDEDDDDDDESNGDESSEDGPDGGNIPGLISWSVQSAVSPNPL
ncbi:hypothetical protein BJY01DRAFT_256243 [Aspergillus pseudoustus]|uniref:Uncharacterized protein n=1 Tax=Aspergillus pseudoustus TaxID=1810923 RepID=A0ABR4IF58_9EURO